MVDVGGSGRGTVHRGCGALTKWTSYWVANSSQRSPKKKSPTAVGVYVHDDLSGRMSRRLGAVCRRLSFASTVADFRPLRLSLHLFSHAPQSSFSICSLSSSPPWQHNFLFPSTPVYCSMALFSLSVLFANACPASPRQPFPVASSLVFCLSLTCSESKLSWLTGFAHPVWQPEKKIGGALAIRSATVQLMALHTHTHTQMRRTKGRL